MSQPPLELAWFPCLREEAVNILYAAAKNESRILRNNHTEDGVLPGHLGFALASALKTKDAKGIARLERDSLLGDSVQAFLKVYQVATKEFQL